MRRFSVIGKWAVRIVSIRYRRTQIAYSTCFPVDSGAIGQELPANSLDSNEALSHARLKFGSRHLLVISIWISLLLTAIRLLGLGYQFVLLLTG